MTTADKIKVLGEKRYSLTRLDSRNLIAYTLDVMLNVWRMSESSSEVVTMKKLQSFKGRGLTRPQGTLYLETLKSALQDNFGTDANAALLDTAIGLSKDNIFRGELLVNLCKGFSNEAVSLDIVSVETLDGINVANGVDFEDLDLPTTLDVVISTGDTVEASITWAEGTYDKTTADDYTLTGTLTTSGRASNGSNLTASIVVTVAAP